MAGKDDEAYINELTSTGTGDFSQAQAEYFANNYTVVDSQTDQATGLTKAFHEAGRER